MSSGGGVKVEMGGSGLGSYSPISTLERQGYSAYNGAAASGHRLYLFVQTNQDCSVSGGVEGILKRKITERSATSPSATTSVEDNVSEGQQQQQQQLDEDVSSNNPFSFLSPDGGGGCCVRDSTVGSTGDMATFTNNDESNSATTTVPTIQKKNNPMGSLWKKVAHTTTLVAKNTTLSLERGMHNLAIRADQGRNPDLVCLGLYSDNGTTLLTMTESQPLLPGASSDGGGIGFTVPLVVPGDFVLACQQQAQAAGNPEQVLVLKLWIRSGAALLQQTKAAKNFLVGQASVSIADLVSSLHGITGRALLPAAFVSLPLSSSLVPPTAKLSLCVVFDTKFAPLCGRGWSLADPDVSVYSATSATKLFHLPLDQSYGMRLVVRDNVQPETTSTTKLMIATERTTESAVVLPVAAAVAKLASQACQVSLHHSLAAASVLQARRMDTAVGDYADVNVQIGCLRLVIANGADASLLQQQLLQLQQHPPLLSAAWQRPDSILEVELVQPTRGVPVSSTGTVPTDIGADAFVPAVSFRFFPKPCRTGILPSLIQQQPGGQLQRTGFLLGNLHLQVIRNTNKSRRPSSVSNHSTTPLAVNPFDRVSMHTLQQEEEPQIQSLSPSSTASSEDVWDCVISLDNILLQQASSGCVNPNQVVEFPVLDQATGQTVATVAMTISVVLQKAAAAATTATTTPIPTTPPTSARDGLVSLVGLPSLLPPGSVQPALDYDADTTSASASAPLDAEGQRRKAQLLTLGCFVSHAYLEDHNNCVRQGDAQILQERAAAYQAALTNSNSNSDVQPLPPHQDRSPRPFRPSASRSDVLLSGIPFNVHTASLSLNVMDAVRISSSSSTAGDQLLGDAFSNTTCGAPADHARGFGNIVKEPLLSPVGSVSGGLRRLELKRQELAVAVTTLQSQLIDAIANHFGQQRSVGRHVATTHVPARQGGHVHTLQRRLYDAVQALHHVSWVCATRRANVFSQALGIALTTFLASLSEKWQSHSAWPGLWTKHGYLVSYEGLLSAAGNELGMIEDASVGIAMLHMVRMVLVQHDDRTTNTTRTAVPGSPYIKWIDLSTSGQYSQRQFTLQIGIVPSYYDQRIPPVLHNGTPVRIYSLLFEVGVDIRQWGANAGTSVMTQFDRGGGGGDRGSAEETAAASPSGLIDDEDDDVGVRDDDVLVQLNYEAFRLLNAYAHSISPANSPQTMATQRTHPLLEKLYQHIVSSAGKMDHNILVEAATLAQQLGGGAAVFCKSGKDRTAMHVTFKQAQFANRFREQQQSSSSAAGGAAAAETNTPASFTNTTLQDAAIIRIYGTRLPICEKNVGQAKYAFNSLQVQFMPETLRPPMSTLAGFLKGGKVFSGGGIES